ncbi:hypothetical protein TWF694_005679 [Orbilia ellipsospora]|uniref:Uncharacterized protein n=1 Tax=Orbilia ellipsospora TaxID=2528407 RepID=A0AAV9WRN9_9PEZI
MEAGKLAGIDSRKKKAIYLSLAFVSASKNTTVGTDQSRKQSVGFLPVPQCNLAPRLCDQAKVKSPPKFLSSRKKTWVLASSSYLNACSLTSVTQKYTAPIEKPTSVYIVSGTSVLTIWRQVASIFPERKCTHVYPQAPIACIVVVATSDTYRVVDLTSKCNKTSFWNMRFSPQKTLC